jgi:hypothetical protein
VLFPGGVKAALLRRELRQQAPWKLMQTPETGYQVARRARAVESPLATL